MKDIQFDTLAYKEPVKNSSEVMTMMLNNTNPIVKVNEAVIFVADYIVKGYDVYCTEINTNSAFDSDLPQWFDFSPIYNKVCNLRFERLILLVEKDYKDVTPSIEWENELKLGLEKRDVQYKKVCVDVDNIYDFDFDEKKDFILRIAWNKDCYIDRLAEDKLAFIKWRGQVSIMAENHNRDTLEVVDIQANPKYKTLPSKNIYQKDKKFIFKLNKLDRKKGIKIIIPNDQKHFDELLSQYDYVEEFIDDVVDAETGLGVEIKDYLMWFRDTSYRLTPNLYLQYREFEEQENKTFRYNRTFAFNCISNQIVELQNGEKVEVGHVQEGDKLKYGGEITEKSNYGLATSKKYLLVNGELKFSISTQVVYCGIIREYRSLFNLNKGDKILTEDGELEIISIETINEVQRVCNIKTEENFTQVDGVFIKSQSENYILGKNKDKILNPLVHQKGLGLDDEGNLVDTIINKMAEQDMPERVVEITFECYGTYFTSEFLFEKPIKVINSMDYDIRTDRRDGKEPFGTHNDSGVEKKKPTFGWASYRPDITESIKHMRVMKLRVGMVCLTPKAPHMKVTETLYGEMVPCKVVRMREVPGKKSHWDIYTMLPTKNYFMNRLHVHNGPNQYTTVYQSDLMGHWDIYHPSSYPGSGTTFYDLTTRLNADLAPVGPHTMQVISTPANYHLSMDGAPSPSAMNALSTRSTIEAPHAGPPAPGKVGLAFSKQPGNPWHTSRAFSTTPQTSLAAFIMTGPPYTSYQPTSYDSYMAVHNTRPGNDWDLRFHGGPQPGPSAPHGEHQWLVRAGNSWADTNLDMYPVGTAPKLSIENTQFVYMKYNAYSTPQRWQVGNEVMDGDFENNDYSPSPLTTPRTSSTVYNWGGVNPPGPNGRYPPLVYQQWLIWDTPVPTTSLATQAINISWRYSDPSAPQANPSNELAPSYF